MLASQRQPTRSAPSHPPYICFCRQSNCFKGELKAANTSLLGKNDYKKVRDKLLEEFPALTKKSLKRVFSDKEETYVLKCSNGTVLYAAGDKPPSFFDDGFGNLYPTLFTLWKIPDMMQELVTHGTVSNPNPDPHPNPNPNPNSNRNRNPNQVGRAARAATRA